jgi:uncharacterized protein YjbI with pentapeptide repeats
VHDGLSGAVLVNLSNFVTHNLIQAVITGADLTEALIEKMLNGSIYLN